MRARTRKHAPQTTTIVHTHVHTRRQHGVDAYELLSTHTYKSVPVAQKSIITAATFVLKIIFQRSSSQRTEKRLTRHSSIITHHCCLRFFFLRGEFRLLTSLATTEARRFTDGESCATFATSLCERFSVLASSVRVYARACVCV